jgi:hypothetical protein
MEEPSPDSVFPGQNKVSSTRREKARLNVLKITFFVLFILCLFLSIFSWHTWKYTDSKTLLMVMLTCLATKIGCVLGIIGSFKGIQEIKYRKLTGDSANLGFGHQILIISFYFLVVVLIGFIIFGTSALFESEKYISYLNDKYNSDHEDWVQRFGDISLEQLEKLGLLMINVVGYTCYIIVLLILIIEYLLLAIATLRGILSNAILRSN